MDWRLEPGVTVSEFCRLKVMTASGFRMICWPLPIAEPAVPAPAPAAAPIAAPLPPPKIPPSTAPTAAPPPTLAAVPLPLPVPVLLHWSVAMLYALPFIISLVNCRVRRDPPAKRPADFTSTTRPSTSAVVGTTIWSSMDTGAEIEPWNTSPTWAFSESTSSVIRILSCVPGGIVTFAGGGGGVLTGALVVAALLDGTVVRSPLLPLLLLEMRGDRCRVRVVVADAGVDDAAVGGGSTAAVGCGGGTLAAEATSRLFTTVFTPSTCAASVAAAERAASLLTVPDRVTTPLLELIVICLSGTLLSAKILFCTSDAICESDRLPILLQPITASARKNSANPRNLLVFFIFAPVLVACFNFRCRAAGFNCEFCKLLVIQYLSPFRPGTV